MTFPVHRLSAAAREAYRDHLLTLDAEDARLRFGSLVGAASIAAYVDRVDFDRDAVFGLRDDRLAVRGAAHVAFEDAFAELGVSVDAAHRRRGMGRALVLRAAAHARNRGVRTLYMHCLAENAAMMHIARGAGMAVVVDAGHADARLVLPPADPLSLADEAMAVGMALVDFTLKTQIDTLARIERALRERA